MSNIYSINEAYVELKAVFKAFEALHHHLTEEHRKVDVEVEVWSHVNAMKARLRDLTDMNAKYLDTNQAAQGAKNEVK
jgi:hypothetical protein